MRVVWILCVIGSITCTPVEYGYGLDVEYDDTGTNPMQEGSYEYGFQETADYEPDSSYDYRTTDTSAGPRSYKSNKMVEGVWSNGGYTGGNSAYGWADPAQVNSVSGSSSEENEPIFSDVSDLEPVYSLSSRSRYQRGRTVFAQTRYIPTESLGLPVPPLSQHNVMYSRQSTPVKDGH